MVVFAHNMPRYRGYSKYCYFDKYPFVINNSCFSISINLIFPVKVVCLAVARHKIYFNRLPSVPMAPVYSPDQGGYVNNSELICICDEDGVKKL